MSTFDPGRSDERAAEQPGYPSAPPPQDTGQQGAYAGGSPQQYGSAPQYAGGHDQPATAGPPPKEVHWASLAMLVSAALGLLSLIINLADSDGIKDSIRESNASLTPSEVDSAYTVSLVFAIVIGLVFSALYVLLAMQLRKGKNWARITTFVLAGLSLLFGLLGLAGNAPALSRLLTVIGLLLSIAIIVLLLMKPAKDYFAAHKAVR